MLGGWGTGQGTRSLILKLAKASGQPGSKAEESARTRPHASPHSETFRELDCAATPNAAAGSQHSMRVQAALIWCSSKGQPTVLPPDPPRGVLPWPT